MKPQLRMTVFLSLFASSVWAAPTLPTVQVYKSPQCGCCEKWVDHMKSAGFKVIAHDTNTVAEHKTRLGVPLAMGSCHTAEVGGYFVEGHVPAGDVKKLLAEKPQAKGWHPRLRPPSHCLPPKRHKTRQTRSWKKCRYACGPCSKSTTHRRACR